MLKCDVLTDLICREEDLARDQVERILEIIFETQIPSFAVYDTVCDEYVTYDNLADLEADLLGDDRGYDIEVFLQVEFREPILRLTNIQ